MKRIFYLIFIVISINLEARTLASNETWSGTHVELDDVIVPSGITLTIDPGTTVKFASGKSLKISGTGQLLAGSLAGATVLFTANDGNWWGHILLENTTSSYLRNCEIEKGDATSLSPNYGGAIHIKTSNVTIEKCIIHNNKAGWGGAIFVNQSVSPTIENCHIYSNTASSSGGGLYFWYLSSPVLKNSIIESNVCSNTGLTYGGGGLAIYTGSGVAKIINCLVVNNTHSRSSKFGDNIHFNSVNATKFINSIVWGSEYSVYYDATPLATNFVNSAVQRTYNSGGEILMSTFTNSFKLNASNLGSSPSGPFFTADDGSDWSLQYSSPCRDAGVNTYTGVTVPTTDYLTNPRVFTKDIGAYEVQYSRWTGTTSDLWTTATNWDASVTPSTGTGDVYIPSGLANYPTNDDSTPPDFIIGAGKQMIIEPGAKVTLDDLTNSGTLNLNSNSSGISSLITNTFSGNDANVQLYLTGGAINDGFRWHLISSPFMTLAKAPIWSVTNELAQWVESYNRISLGEGWVAADGWDYATSSMGGPTFDNLDLGKGYTHYFATPQTYTLSGELNTEDKTVTIKCTYPLQPLLYGHNLLGNPFLSGLNWNAIVNGTYPDSTSKVLHYRKDAEHVYYINYVGSDVGVNGIIPPMQGFFVKAYGKTRSITLPASARVHDSIPARYKGKGPVIPLVRIDLALGDRHDNTVIRFDDAAKAGLDNDFDAVKDFISTTKQSIYSISEGVKYVINGQPFPLETADYPIAVNLLTTGNYTASVTEFQGLDNYNVYLIDNQTGFIADLKTTPVLTFTGSAGLFTDRFILRVSNVLTGTEETELSENIFNLYQGFNMINIQPMSDEWDGKSGSIRVLDLTGKTASDLQNTEFRKNSVIQVAAPGARGLYVVEIRSGVKRWVGKVVIR